MTCIQVYAVLFFMGMSPAQQAKLEGAMEQVRWDAAQEKFFSEGGVFDAIYQPQTKNQ